MSRAVARTTTQSSAVRALSAVDVAAKPIAFAVMISLVFERDSLDRIRQVDSRDETAGAVAHHELCDRPW